MYRLKKDKYFISIIGILKVCHSDDLFSTRIGIINIYYFLGFIKELLIKKSRALIFRN